MAITQLPQGHGEDSDSESHQHAQPGPVQSPPVLREHSLSNASTVTVDIESWTVAALESLRIAPIARGTGNALSIPLDDAHQHAEVRDAAGMKLHGVAFDGPTDPYGATIAPPRRPPSRRDSMRKRDALVKGKEGSRQRRRWENDHLLHVPNVVPPLPSDWQIHPTHRVLPTVPYQLAQYWDKGLRERVEAQKQQKRGKHPRRSTNNNNDNAGGPGPDEPVGHVPRDLRNTAKRTPAVKSWLRVLEEPVRAFVVERGLASASASVERAVGGNGESSSDETDSDDEEIVFVGRNGRMRDGKPWKPARRQVAGQGADQGHGQGEGERGLVLELEMEEEAGGGAFKRWLTHSISDYYGLDSKSVMVGTPARRVVYVGAKQKPTQTQTAARQNLPSRPVLPPPLWEMF